MIASNLMKLFPLAVLLTTSPFAAPHAYADPMHAGVEAFQATLTYDAAQPAPAIYADLETAAKRACEAHGTRSLHVRVAEKQCVSDVLGAAVQKIQRADLAQVYAGRISRG